MRTYQETAGGPINSTLGLLFNDLTNLYHDLTNIVPLDDPARMAVAYMLLACECGIPDRIMFRRAMQVLSVSGHDVSQIKTLLGRVQ